MDINHYQFSVMVNQGGWNGQPADEELLAYFNLPSEPGNNDFVPDNSYTETFRLSNYDHDLIYTGYTNWDAGYVYLRFEHADGSQYNYCYDDNNSLIYLLDCDDPSTGIPSGNNYYEHSLSSNDSEAVNDVLCDYPIHGCTDVDACNYNPSATDDDSSCESTSCLDECGVPNGDNSSCSDDCGVPNGDNSSCLDDCGVPNGDNSSCLDECGVLNGDNSSCLDCAGVPNGTSVDLGCGCNEPAAVEGYDCDGNCLNDSDGDLVCDEFEVAGCTYLTADNFDENATDPDGSCEWNGCTDPEAMNYDEDANKNDESCIYLDCMDSLAYNYNPDASVPGYCAYMGCTDQTALNYDSSANTDDGSCYYVVGCMDETAFNFNSLADHSDSTVNCYSVIEGCMDEDAYNFVALTGDVLVDINTSDSTMCDYLGCTYEIMFNYDSLATIDDGSCYPVIFGCMDDTMFNFTEPTGDNQVDVNTDDGSCYEVLVGCMDTLADNYNDYDLDSLSNEFTGDVYLDINTNDDNSCIYFGCINPLAFNFDSLANTNNNSCYPVIVGCLDENSDNYNDFDGDGFSNALTGINTTDINTNDSTMCVYYGCTDTTAFNFNVNANVDDGSCTPVIYGCMDDNYVEFDSLANTDTTMCFTEVILGCTNVDASNYYEDANTDDGSCIDKIIGCLDENANNYNDYDNDSIPNILTGNILVDINTNDSTLCLYFGCMSEWAENYDSLANVDDGSCSLVGCMEEWANNFNANATIEADTCYREGCMAEWAENYDSLATQNTIEADSCYLLGCMVTWADNYNANATQEADTCYREGCMFEWADNYDSLATQNTLSINECSLLGCSYEFMFNYDVNVTEDDNSCYPIIKGCTDSTAFNFIQPSGDVHLDVNTDDGSCIPYIYGCLDSIADNFNPNANAPADTADCIYYGCMVDTMFNYNPDATHQLTGSCIPYAYGCMDSTMFNFDPLANTENDPSSCTPYLYGCTDSLALNFDVLANTLGDSTCVEKIFGCMDTTMFNFDSSANIDTNSCVPFVYGCMDSLALNYDSLANTLGDSTCIEKIYGCMDELAFNYDPTATLDTIVESSCVDKIYGCMNADYLEFDESVNTNDQSQCVTLITYGCMNVEYLEYNPMANVDDQSCNTIAVYGCTDSTAFNYNYLANSDNESCYPVISGCLDTLADNYFSPSGNLQIDVNTADEFLCEYYGCTYPEMFNYDSIANVDDGSCIPVILGCHDEEACNTNLSSNTADSTLCEYSTEFYDCAGNCVNDTDGDGTCDENEVVGCTDVDACNYNVDATDSGDCVYKDGVCDSCSGETDGTGVVVDNDSDDDGTCDADEVVGCTDVDACNYNVDATDSGDCVYADGVCDSCSGETDGTGVVVDNDADDDEVCDANEVAGCLDVAYDNYNSSATDSAECLGLLGCTDPLYAEYNEEAEVDNGSCLDLIAEGCTYSWAFNYDSLAVTDDGSCIPVVIGCTDPTASNYDQNANTDTNEGSCQYPIYGCTDSTAFNYDPEADVDNGNCIPVIEGCTDSTASNYDQNANTDDESCIPVIEGCTDEDADNFVYPIGSPLVDINTPNSEMCIYYGCTYSYMSNYNPQANTNDGSCIPVVLGCIDELALNYEAPTGDELVDPNTDDGSCYYIVGCMDDTMFNYNSDADHDDGSCVPVIDGCLIEEMHNYNSSANTDDGSCYPVIKGCMDPEADNFIALVEDNQVDVNTEDGSCVYLGCTDPNADNYLETSNPNASEDANQDDGSCYREGCMSDWADNFDDLATIDDGSCYRLGCTFDWADNFDDLATTDDGSCYKLGCTFDWADNYDSQATIDDESCYREGCMSDWADNYDSLATQNTLLENECYREGCMTDYMDNFDSLATLDDGSCYRNGCMYESMINFDSLATQDDGSCNAEQEYLDSQIDISLTDTVSHFENTILELTANYDAQIQSLNSQISDLEVDIVELENNLIDANDQILALNLQLVSAQDSISILNAEIHELEDYVTILEFRITQKEDLIASLNSDLLTTIASYESEIDSLVFSHVDEISIINLDHQNTVSELYSVISGLNSNISTLSFSNDSLEVVVTDLIADTTNFEIYVDYLENELSEAVSENSSLVTQNGLLESQVEFLEGDTTVMGNTIISLESEITIWTDSIVSLNSSLSLEEDNNFSLTIQNGTLQNTINNLMTDTANLNAQISQLELDVVEAFDHGYGNGNTDGFEAGVASVDITSDNQAIADQAYNSGFNDGVASVDTTSPYGEGYAQGVLDGVASVDITTDNQASYDAGYADGASSVIPEDGVSQSDLDSVLALLDECSSDLDECINDPQNVPISIDLLAGWNMIGYSLSSPQDIVASFEPIEDDIEIVKNNYGQTYWPEFGFNGIGDLIPGQGYQLRLTQDAMDFVFVPIEGRVELTPTVPQWAIDMEVPLHPNDIRTLVRVVNLSGQEVNPELTKGEVLLYLYNDGTVEKRLNQ